MSEVHTLILRRRAWPVRLARWLINPKGCWPTMDCRPWWFYWFAILVPLRGAQRWYAGVFGYFWMPCPLCARHYGGHEWRNARGLASSVPDPFRPPPGPNGPWTSVGICPRCTRAGRGRHP